METRVLFFYASLKICSVPDNKPVFKVKQIQKAGIQKDGIQQTHLSPYVVLAQSTLPRKMLADIASVTGRTRSNERV